MPLPLAAGAVVGGISALYKIGHGLAQEKDAKYRAARNLRPNFDIQQEYFDNQNIAENLAGQGYTSKTVDNYNSENERGLQSTIDATLQAGGGAGAIQGALSNYNLGNRSFAAADAEKQTKNIEGLFDRNKDLAAQKVQQWVLNKYKPFQDEAATIAAEKSASQQNISTGLAEGTADVSSLAKGSVSSDLNTTFKKPSGILNGSDGAHNNYFDVLRSTTPGSGSMESDYYGWLKDLDKNGGSVADVHENAESDINNLSDAQMAAIRKILNRAY